MLILCALLGVALANHHTPSHGQLYREFTNQLSDKTAGDSKFLGNLFDENV